MGIFSNYGGPGPFFSKPKTMHKTDKFFKEHDRGYRGFKYYFYHNKADTKLLQRLKRDRRRKKGYRERFISNVANKYFKFKRRYFKRM